MPEYCDTTPEMDNVPPVSEMKPYKPYFAIAEGSSSFEVHVKVESECYYIAGNVPGFPLEGLCGEPDDLQLVINLDKQPNCSDLAQKETVLTVRVNYREDPDGHKVNIYVIDRSEGSKVRGESRSRKKLH